MKVVFLYNIVIYSHYKENDLESGTRKAEILMKRRVRGLANNKSKWYILDNGDVLFTPFFRLSYHIFKTKEAILKEVKLTLQEVDELQDECIRRDIRFDMSRIDP
ncbi:hypothetical protein RhiirA1_467692 [Rhizophagus irregularis]|uniref:Uncharacterized protein n=1 Tax=Rhizophagus irregularis TaxID=588596 RepID=A0A2I1EEE9_9GLOM|nr:hypothetical protein RhiirA1_467692 [Rhizophagus irregularis]PKY20495.1 hypothetical protein RhiirB3_433792 [Rhizophagus irregularis]CAB4487626.1 unnamed protein product [Rhizophagus irregularis]CAB5367286.1 unnamed protein product [Rhizophagus irregularis]